MDPQKPTYDALVAVFMGVPINTGKLSLLADIKAMKAKKGMDGLTDGDGANKQAREILRRLVEWGDVVLCNQVKKRETCLHHPVVFVFICFLLLLVSPNWFTNSETSCLCITPTVERAVYIPGCVTRCRTSCIASVSTRSP